MSDRAKKLKEKILSEKKCGFLKISDERVSRADSFCQGYKDFLNGAKTEREIIKSALEMAKAKGFVEFDYNKKYNVGDKVYYNNRNNSLVLAVIG